MVSCAKTLFRPVRGPHPLGIRWFGTAGYRTRQNREAGLPSIGFYRCEYKAGPTDLRVRILGFTVPVAVFIRVSNGYGLTRNGTLDMVRRSVMSER